VPRLVVLVLTVLAIGLLLFKWLGRSPTLPAEVPVLSAYRSFKGANNLPRLQRHAGVDFGGPLGSPVIAAADGVVTNAFDWPTGCGRGVILSHREFGRFTAYCHLQEALVRTGQEVARGEIIGRMGTTGNAVGISHVHLELCTTACMSHADGDLWGTADPLKLSAGCFDPQRSYPLGRLALTYPVPCGGVYRQRSAGR
jgi:murein DD-endopeptidase MepM/ murein hydrolase activator NlpD